MKLAIDLRDVENPRLLSYREDKPPILQSGLLLGKAINSTGTAIFSQIDLLVLLATSTVDDGTGDLFELALVDNDDGVFLTTDDFDTKYSSASIQNGELTVERGFTKDRILDLIRNASFGRVFN